jgi:dephospho-CoA kinase
LGRSIKLKKIAVTGGIASGKSTVCQFFEQLGAFVVSADAIVHQLLVPTTQLGKEIIALLGADIVVDEKLSREKIAQKVFRNPPLLKKFEESIHPNVQKVIEAKYTAASQTHAPLFVAEIPLLFEANQAKFYDWVIVVACDEKKSRERCRFDADEYERRNQRLMPIEEKIKQADSVVENNGNLDDLYQTIQHIYNSLKENL